jgi:hypothetical protein
MKSPRDMVLRRLRKLDSYRVLWNYRVLVINARTRRSPGWMRTSHQERLIEQRPLYRAEFRRRDLKVPDPGNVLAYEAALRSAESSYAPVKVKVLTRKPRRKPQRKRRAKTAPRGRREPKHDAMSHRLPGSGWTRQR